jgi:PAS domain S-box-containing protein
VEGWEVTARMGQYGLHIEEAVDGILLGSPGGLMIAVNTQALVMTGYARADLLGRPIDILFPPQVLAAVPLRYDLLEEGRRVVSERDLLRKDGTLLPIEMSTRRMPDGTYQTFLRDISLRRQTQEALRTSEERYRLIFSHAPFGIFRFDTLGVIQDGNPAFVALLGSSLEALVGFAMLERVANPGVLLAVREALEGRSGFYEGEYLSVTGDRLIAIRMFTYQIISAAGVPLGGIGVVEDLTKRQAAEASYRGLFESVQEGIYILDRQGRFLDINGGALAMYGRTKEELIGRTPEAMAAPGMNDLAQGERMLQAAFGGEPQAFEFWGLRANGEVFPKEVRLYRGTYFGQDVVIALGRDISERRRAAEALRQAQKLESLGVLAGGIAHDFNNLLTAILGNLDLAQVHSEEDAPALPFLEKARKTVLRAADLTQQMLAYSGKGQFMIQPQQLNGLVRDLVDLLHVSISKKVRLTLDLAPDLPAVEADAAQFHQVLMNLVTNASEAIGERQGAIHVATRFELLEPDAFKGCFGFREATPGPCVVLEVTDTGSGMSREVQERIFDPFFTTKMSGRGLGLSAMLGILRGHRAGIRIDSAPGQGSRFTLFFPVTPGAVAPTLEREAAAVGPRPRSRLDVLLVDDEPDVLEAVSELLVVLGYRVTTAMDGREALERFASGIPVDLVLMDLTMPRMDGREAFEAFHAQRPELPVVLYSGYSEQESLHNFKGGGPAAFIQKPFLMAQLQEVLGRVLSASRSATPSRG